MILIEAKNEYRVSFDWYREINPELAKKFYLSFKECLNIIKSNPLIFQIRYDEVRIKMFKTFPYLIHYQIIDNLIIIQSVCHTSRDGNLNIFL